MNVLTALVLGVVQGVTEFLPISSDGHLVLTYHVFGLEPDLAFEVFLHLATLLAMLAYFWRDILSVAAAMLSRDPADASQRRLGLVIILGTLVSGVIALALKDVVEPLSYDLRVVGAFFLVTSAALAIAEWRYRVADDRDAHQHLDPASLSWARTALVGLAQGAAVLPGVSRSGLTISSGMLAGIDREEATRFAFLLGIPIITAASLVSMLDVVKGDATLPPLLPSLVGFAAAGIAGYAAIAWLLALVKRRSLVPFAVYTCVVGVGTLVLYALS